METVVQKIPTLEQSFTEVSEISHALGFADAKMMVLYMLDEMVESGDQRLALVRAVEALKPPPMHSSNKLLHELVLAAVARKN